MYSKEELDRLMKLAMNNADELGFVAQCETYEDYLGSYSENELFVEIVPSLSEEEFYDLKRCHKYYSEDKLGAISFFSTKDPYGEFSNWYRSTFEYGSYIFVNSEQFFMWQKALLFGDKEIADTIVCTVDPKEIKALGRRVKNFNQRLWDSVKYDLMYLANYLKYSQNDELKQKLIDTKGRHIEEASPYDEIWGIGKHGKGQNLLGKVLMELRDYFINEDR